MRTELGFPQVRVGDDGAVVVALQRLLTVKDHPVPVTGFFDDATEEAAKALEQETNIPPDGIVGRVTWQQLAAPIRRGDSGQAVLAAEELLQLAGFDITPDDRFTNGTQDLVLQFQQRQGLPADGIVDIDTWRVLLALAFREQNPPLAAGPPTTTTAPTSLATSDIDAGRDHHAADHLTSGRGDEPPRQVDGLGDADARRRHDHARWWRAVVDEADRAAGAQVGAGVRQVEGQRLAQLAGAVGEVGGATVPRARSSARCPAAGSAPAAAPPGRHRRRR